MPALAKDVRPMVVSLHAGLSCSETNVEGSVVSSIVAPRSR